MISNNGYTWTDRDETLTAYEGISAHYNGEPLFKPVCTAEKRDTGGKLVECGKTTCYVVMTDAEIRKQFSWVAFAQTCVTKYEGRFYYPVQRCVECEAREAGYRDGWRHQDDYQRAMTGIPKAPLTPQDIIRWKEIYKAAFEKGRERDQKEALEQSVKKDKARYLPTKESARAGSGR